MPNQFQNIKDDNWSLGVDALSTEVDIPDGYVEELENFDPTPEKYLSKRKGYQGVYGNLPVRVMSVQYTDELTGNLCLTLDGSIDLSRLASTPLVIQGRLSVPTAGGDFSNDADSVHYYSGFTTEIVKNFLSGTNTLVIPASEHSLDTPYIWTSLSSSTAAGAVGNSQFYANTISTDIATSDITISYTNSGLPFVGYVAYLDRRPSPGETYVSGTTTISGTGSVTITSGTHQLSNNQILVKCFIDTGTAYVEFDANSITIAANGDVTVGYVVGGPAVNAFFVLSDAPLGQVITGTIDSGATVPSGPKSLTVSLDVSSPFFFVACYLESGSNLVAVIPDSITYDDDTKTAAVTFTNDGPATSFTVYWLDAAVSANKLCVNAAVISPGVDDPRPQLSIWGLDHATLYGSNAAERAGWVTHIDTYRSQGEEFLVAGLGGVFHKGAVRDEITGPNYLIPAAYPNLRARVDGTVSVGPTFIDVTDTTFRTRGNIKGDNLAANFARVTSYTYNVSTNLTDILLDIPQLTVDGTLSDIIHTAAGVADRATITGAPFGRLNGSWAILGVSLGTNQLTLSVDIPDAKNSLWDDAGGVGQLGIFTDSFTLSSTSPYLLDDIILSESIPVNLPVRCAYSDGTTLGVYDATQQVDFPNAIRIAGSRVSATIPIRDLNGNPTVAGFVAGDMISVDGYEREFRVLEIDTVDKTLTVDEIFEWNDAIQSTNLVSVTGRWIPFEAPTDNFTATPSTYVTYMSESPYDNQPFVHSSMANDSMYLSNGVDRPEKIDGLNIYRPGLPRWQSQLFATVNTAEPAVIQLNNTSCVFVSIASNKFTVAAEDVKTFTVGTRIRADGHPDTIYTIIDTDVTNAVIIVDQDIDTAIVMGGTVREVCTFSYYFRLNMIDINNNIIASAATGSEDCVIELTEDAQIRIRLLGLPALDNYDYDRIEVTVNRTKKNGVAPYYVLSTIPLNFDSSGGYIDYIDSDSDEDLRDLDQAMTALKGAELGTAWSQPLRSKFITSVSNSLIQGNFRSDPYLNIQFVDTGSRITPAVLNGFRFLFKKDINDAGTTTDMTNRVGVEWRNTGVAALGGITGGVGSFTVTATANGAAVGDWVYLFRSATPSADATNYFAGWWQIATITDADNFVVNFPNVPGSFTFSDDVDSALFATQSGDIPVWLGTDYNYSWRREVGGDVTAPYERLAVLRMAGALNAGMRMTDITLPDFQVFMPWYVADAGGEFDIGQLSIRQPLNIDTGSSVLVPAMLGDYSLFINSVLRDPDEEVGVQVQDFGSRLLASYQNFPEIMDNPTAIVDSQSDSAVDVNPADGQSITAVIPLFGEAAFGAAQKDQIVVAFKENSIYIVNFAEKRAGRNAVQKIQSENLGCNSPNAVTTTKGGVVYANRSGIYKLDVSLVPQYMGRRLQRFWRENVDTNRMDVFTITNFSSQSLVKMSFVFKDETLPTNQFVYNTTKENLADDSALGSWTTYTNWNAIGFANMGATNYNATTYGRVFGTRNLGERSDYRDDSSPIVANVLFRAMSFGNQGIRKMVPSATITFRNQENQGLRDIDVFYCTNMDNTFDNADPSTIPNRGPVNDLSDTTGKRSVLYKYSFNNKRGVYFQMRIVNDKIDQALDITNVTYRVSGLSGQGIPNARP